MRVKGDVDRPIQWSIKIVPCVSWIDVVFKDERFRLMLLSDVISKVLEAYDACHQRADK